MRHPILKNQSVEVVILREHTKYGREFLNILHTLTGLKQTANAEFEIRSLLSQAWLVLAAEIQTQRQNDLFQTPSAHERTKDILSFIHKHY